MPSIANSVDSAGLQSPGKQPVTFDAIERATGCLKHIATRTPVLTSRTLDEICGVRIFLKCENFQRAGAFKFRGAYNAVAANLAAAKASGVIAHSSGNHAQALALAGQLLDVRVTVVMPSDAPGVKIEATRGYGADVVFFDPATEQRDAVTARLQKEHGWLLIPPFNHPDIIAGQGTVAVELLEQAGALDTVMAPCGGGGLLSGTAVAVSHLQPDARIVGVEPESANNGQRAFRSGKLELVANPRTMADGLKPGSLGEYTLAIIREHVHEMITVSEDEIRATLKFLWERMKLVAEPSGAVALAAVFHRKLDNPGERVGVIVSGGNADIGAVADWLRAPQA